MKTNCLICDTPTNTRCTRCKSVYYCSKEHIAQDWPSHKEYCKKISAANGNTFDAILFAANENKPRLIKIPWSWGPLDEEIRDIPWQKLDKEPWFRPEKNCSARTLNIQRLGFQGPSLGRTLALWYDDNFMINDSPINRCILNVTGSSPHPWAGNLFCLREISEDHYDNARWDEDLDPVVQYFKAYGKS